MYEILKKIDEMINNTKELLNGYEKNERLDVKLRTLLIVKEIIQAEQKDKCYCTEECEMEENRLCNLYGPCPHQQKIKTKGDVIRESNESLARFILECKNSCDYCASRNDESGKGCMKKGCKEWILEYLNQPSESEENMDMLTDLTPKESARIQMLIEHQEKELDRRNRLIGSLTTNLDYWEREAKKYCAQIGEIRILAAQELCNK